MNIKEKNIVLIGMRGSGKTTIGAILAGQLHKEFISMDGIIAYEAGILIPQIVERYGWQYFRELESQVTKKVASLSSTINATGGGVILNPENVKALQKTGILFWLNVSVDNSLKRIGQDPNRPSLTGVNSRKDDMIATYNEREPLYRKAADYIINTNNKYQETIADEIIKLLESISC